MRTVPIVAMEPERQLGASVVGGLIGMGVGPFPEGGLDKALCLAVGLGRVWPGADVLEAEIAAGIAEGLRAVA